MDNVVMEPEYLEQYLQVKTFVQDEIVPRVQKGEAVFDGCSGFTDVYFNDAQLFITLVHPHPERESYPIYDIREDEDCDIEYLKESICHLLHFDYLVLKNLFCLPK